MVDTDDEYLHEESLEKISSEIPNQEIAEAKHDELEEKGNFQEVEDVYKSESSAIGFVVIKYASMQVCRHAGM